MPHEKTIEMNFNSKFQRDMPAKQKLLTATCFAWHFHTFDMKNKSGENFWDTDKCRKMFSLLIESHSLVNTSSEVQCTTVRTVDATRKNHLSFSTVRA